jgi:hypothetical protein
MWPIKQNGLYGQCLRIIRLSNDLFSAGQNVYLLLAVMRHFRGMPSRTLRRLRSKAITVLSRSPLCGVQGDASRDRTGAWVHAHIRRTLLGLPLGIVSQREHAFTLPAFL